MQINRRQALVLAAGGSLLASPSRFGVAATGTPQVPDPGTDAGRPRPGQPAGGTLAVVSIDTGTVAVLDAESGAPIHTISIGGGPHEIARIPGTPRALVPDYFSLRPGRTLHLIDLATGSLESSFDLLDPSPAESEESATGEPTPSPRPFTQLHGVCAFGSDRALVTSEARASLLVVNHREARVERVIPTHARLSHMVLLARDGRRAFIANKTDGNLSVVDVESGQFLRHVPTGAGAQGMALHPTRPELWVANIIDDSLTILDEGTLEVLRSHPIHDYPVRLAFTPDGRWCLVTNYGGGSVSLLDGTTGEPLGEMNLPPVTRAEASGVTPDPREADRRTRFGDSPLPVGLTVHPSGEVAYISCTRSNRIERLDLGGLSQDSTDTARWLEPWEGVVHPDGSLFLA